MQGVDLKIQYIKFIIMKNIYQISKLYLDKFRAVPLLRSIQNVKISISAFGTIPLNLILIEISVVHFSMTEIVSSLLRRKRPKI